MAEYVLLGSVAEIDENNSKYEKQKREREEIEKKRQEYSKKKNDSGSFSKIKTPMRRESKLNFAIDRDTTSIFLTTTAGALAKKADKSEKPTFNSILKFQQSKPPEPKSQTEITTPPIKRRYYTELFSDHTEFVDIFKQMEADCLEHIEQINIIAEDTQAHEKYSQGLLSSLSNEISAVRDDLGELKSARDDLMRQLKIKEAQLHSSNKRELHSHTELSESQKANVIGKIYALGCDSGVLDKKERKPSEMTYQYALDVLKNLTLMTESIIATENEYRASDKKAFERDNREYNSMKRNSQRLTDNINKELMRDQQLEAKRQLLEKIDREKGGRRKDMVRQFENLTESLTSNRVKEEEAEELRRELEYFRDD